MAVNLETFFTALSERAYKENDLSDMTYALCQSDEVFKQFFLDFFFPEGHLWARDCVITRERSCDLGRPDFWIDYTNGDNKTVYIVEVKIWDGSHHFDQYYDILNKCENGGEGKTGEHEDVKVWNRLGYIANYSVQHNKVNVRTWYEFAEQLKRYAGFNDQAIKAYLSYLQNVCPYDSFVVEKNYKLRIANFVRVRDFNDSVINAIEVNRNEGIVPYNRSSRRFQSMYRMGQYFEVRKCIDGKSVWGWIGAVYLCNRSAVCVEFEDREGWGKLVCDRFRDKVSKGVLRFYAVDSSIDESSLLKDVVEYVKDPIGHQPDKFSLEGLKENGGWPDALLDMKVLPFVLEQYVLGMTIECKNKIKYVLNRAYGSDEENPVSHCGRYFQLDVANEDEKAIANSGTAGAVVGWIGVLFDREKNNSPRMVLQLPVNRVGVESLKNSEPEVCRCEGAWYTFDLCFDGNDPIVVGNIGECVRSVFEERVVL